MLPDKPTLLLAKCDSIHNFVYLECAFGFAYIPSQVCVATPLTGVGELDSGVTMVSFIIQKWFRC